MMCPRRRALTPPLTAGLLVVLMLALGVSTAGASQPRTRKVPAHFVYIVDNSNGCTWGIGIDFPRVPGATSYLVSYWDGYYMRVITGTLTPQQLGTDPAAPAGTLYTGVTGGGYSPPCQGAGDPTEGGRFSRGATVVANLPPPSKLSGTVVSQMCSKSSCVRKPQAGVRVVAKPTSAGTGGSARTDKKGRYSMRLDEGSYDVSLAGLKGVPAKRLVSLSGDVSGVDFRTCQGGARAASPLSVFSCAFIVKVSVRDVAGEPLPNVQVLADNTSAVGLLNIPFHLILDAAATTDSSGTATLELYEDNWQVALQPDLAPINPVGLKETVFSEGTGNEYQVGMSQCQNGRIETEGSGLVPKCRLDLAVGKGIAHVVHISSTAFVAPVDVSLGSGLATGYLEAHNKTPTPETSINVNQPGRSQLRLLVPIYGYQSGTAEYNIFERTATFGPTAVDVCTPGQIIAVPFGESSVPACHLSLSATGSNVRGRVAFSLPH